MRSSREAAKQNNICDSIYPFHGYFKHTSILHAFLSFVVGILQIGFVHKKFHWYLFSVGVCVILAWLFVTFPAG